jgi:hypothetical protein
MRDLPLKNQGDILDAEVLITVIDIVDEPFGFSGKAHNAPNIGKIRI